MTEPITEQIISELAELFAKQPGREPTWFAVSDLIGPPEYPRIPVTPETMEASRAQPGDFESAAAVFDAAQLAAIVPIDRARKPRSPKQLAVDIHNAHLLMRYEYGESETSRKYAELVDTGARQIIARDPMPSVAMFDASGAMASVYVELPGPNCLDTMSERLKLTDEERALFRTRREDAATLLAERAAQMRAELETP